MPTSWTGASACRRLLLAAQAAPHHRRGLSQVKLRRQEVGRRDGHEGEEAVDLARRSGDELAVEAHHLGCLLDGPEGRSGDHRGHRLGAEAELGDHTEVAAAAPDRPEQLGFSSALARAPRCRRRARRRRRQVVDGQPVAAGEVPQSAAEGEAADAGASRSRPTGPRARARGSRRRPRARCIHRRPSRCGRRRPPRPRSGARGQARPRPRMSPGRRRCGRRRGRREAVRGRARRRSSPRRRRRSRSVRSPPAGGRSSRCGRPARPRTRRPAGPISSPAKRAASSARAAAAALAVVLMVAPLSWVRRREVSGAALKVGAHRSSVMTRSDPLSWRHLPSLRAGAMIRSDYPMGGQWTCCRPRFACRPLHRSWAAQPSWRP